MKFLYQISFIIIAVIIFFTVTDGVYKNVSNLKTDVNTYNLALKNSTDLQRTRDDLINKYQSITQENKDRLEHFLPNSVNNIQLILEVEKLANLYGMPIKNIKFQGKNMVNPSGEAKTGPNIVIEEEDPSAKLPYGIFPLEFTVDGKYSDFIYFLRDLEYNLRLVDTQSVSFTVPSPTLNQVNIPGATITPTVDPNIYSFTIKANIYWLK